MDFTNIKCISGTCKGKYVTMIAGGGGSFSTHVTCPICGLCLLIVPLEGGYSYTVERKRRVKHG